MAEEIMIKCKNCGEPFSYSEAAYRLMAERGESRFLRCQECRQPHGREIKEVEIPYSSLQRRVVPGLDFYSREYTFHGEKILQREDKKKVDYSENLTITDEEILTLYQMLEEYQVVVVTAPTGAGKSTFVPERLIEPPENYVGDFVERLIRQGQIIITQPRILPTLATVHTAAEMSGSSVGPGHLFGFRYSEEDKSDHWNIAKTITDGTLPNWIREGKLGQYSLIMVDEAHERSCNIDWILGTLKKELLTYPQLRVIIASATINAQKFVDAFQEVNVSAEFLDLSFLARKKKQKGYIHFWKDENAYILSPEGVLEKTTCKCWLCQKLTKEKREFWASQKDEISEQELPEIITILVSQILAETRQGDILVFLHGEGTINQTVRKIEARHKEVKVIPAYRRIQEDVERELAKETTRRRVIVGTNLLETSLTLQEAVYGIDSGFIKEAKWDPSTQISTLPTERHSQDGRKQRWGRLGRTEDGYVYNLYTKEEFEKAEEHTLPEITRSSLEDSLVNLKGAGVTEVDQFPWMERPSDHPRMEEEIKRARQSLRERGVIDQKEEITERALELLGIPRQQAEASFLVSADDQGFLFEAMTALFLMSTREQEARTGANLYSSGLGLLLWESEWDAKTKAKVWTIHQGLRTGCRDDLDFVIKLAYCLREAEKKDITQEWAKRHFVNYENLQKTLSYIDELITGIFGEEREESVREIDIIQLEKIRALMAATWPDRIVSLKSGEPITYPIAGKTKVGAVSPHCAGNWQIKKQAIVAAAVEEEAIIDGYPQKVPTASFMVQLPGQVREEDQAGLFPERISIEDFTEEKRETLNLGKRKGDTPEVKIHKVCRDPVGRGGWILARTEEGFDIPVELSEMSLSPWGPGLERIEGKTLSLTVKDLYEDGLPQLSNIDRVIEDLGAMRKEVSKKSTFPGYVVEINEEEETATAVIQRAEGIIHPFEIYKDFVPGRALSSLRIGEEVIINLSMPRTERDHIQVDRLTREEIDSIRILPGGEYVREKNEVSFSYCLGANDVNKWPARPEAIDFVRRHSFQYCLIARIEALKERLSQLKEMDKVEGVVTQINYEEAGKTIKSVQVVVKDNIPGFAFGSDLGSLRVSEGKKIQFYVRAVDPDSGFLRLVSKQSEDEKKKRQEEFTSCTQANIRRWEGNIIKARAAIERIRQNIAKNKARPVRTKEFEDRVKLWIAEDERKIRDIELSIRDWLSKIDSARRKLR
jgi:HrpA-like RNA helicase